MKFIQMGMVVSVFFACVSSVEAATLYMDPNTAAINRGDTISVTVRLDTDEEECVNTIDGVINYTDNLVPVDTSRGSSILSIWLEEPVIDKANRTITFAGGIPNGYCGRIIGDPRLTNHVLELVFTAPGMQIGTPESGNVGKVTFGDGTRVLLNDGFGTDAPLKLFDSKIDISKSLSNTISNEWNDRVNADNTPPQKFAINLDRTSNAFSNRYFISFNTTDKQSGIDYYEVIEEPLEEKSFFSWGAATAPWARVQSPYVLNDQSLNSIIRVRAFDKAGNEYIAVLIPDESQRSLSGNTLALIIGVSLGLVILLGLITLVWFIFRRRQRSRAEDSHSTTEADDMEFEEYEEEDETEFEDDEEVEYEDDEEDEEEYEDDNIK